MGVICIHIRGTADQKSESYSWKLEPHDRVPSGKRTDISLREKIRELRENERNGILYRGGDLSVLELVEKYLNTKNGVRPTTQNGYRTVVNFLKKDPFGEKRIDKVRVLDAKEWIRLTEKRKRIQQHSFDSWCASSGICTGGRERFHQKEPV